MLSYWDNLPCDVKNYIFDINAAQTIQSNWRRYHVRITYLPNLVKKYTTRLQWDECLDRPACDCANPHTVAEMEYCVKHCRWWTVLTEEENIQYGHPRGMKHRRWEEIEPYLWETLRENMLYGLELTLRYSSTNQFSKSFIILWQRISTAIADLDERLEIEYLFGYSI